MANSQGISNMVGGAASNVVASGIPGNTEAAQSEASLPLLVRKASSFFASRRSEEEAGAQTRVMQ